jgi:hypothetical protein
MTWLDGCANEFRLERAVGKESKLGSIGGMTRKNFIALADALRANIPTVDSTSYDEEASLFEDIVTSIMEVCQCANPRFNRTRFSKACGLDGVQNRRALVEAA